MNRPLLVFVHSPLVGPLTWWAVADRFAAQGYPVAVPDLRAALSGGPPYHDNIARAVAAAVAGRIRAAQRGLPTSRRRGAPRPG